MTEEVKSRAEKWLQGPVDENTKSMIRNMIANDQTELTECFYRDLEFGTGGLRGIMGVGTNRMNIYTVGLATQGLSNYLKKNFGKLAQIKVAIAHDSRNNSRLFAETVADIFTANGFYVYLFESLRPTPELSFAVRQYGCQSGVVITASHNPKEYNGYKAYWEDGAQVTEPHDQNIVNEALSLTIDDINFKGKKDQIQLLGQETDDIYLSKIKALSLAQEEIKKHADMKIVYTPLHGTGVKLVPEVLHLMGFRNIITVKEQEVSDGNFPTIISPNPEEPKALEMAIQKAIETGADLVMATDPDADRVGIAVRKQNDEFILLNGNQTGSILVYYLVSAWANKGKLTGKEYVVKTIVTTELIKAIADKFSVQCYDVLTGFKYIAEIIRQNEGKSTFIGGGEESYGYLAADFVRDKDAIMSCALIAETAAWAKEKGKTLYELLLDIYQEYGCYREGLVNITKKGKSGAEEIQQMMANFRSNPPQLIDGSKVVLIKDYQLKIERDLLTGQEKKMDLPKSNVLQFFMADGSKVSVRPSGTEPKIKFYIGVMKKLENGLSATEAEKQLDDKIINIKNSLGLN